MTTINDLGRIAFEAYSRATGGKTYDGKDIPPFSELGPRIQEAWETAAKAVKLENGYALQELLNAVNAYRMAHSANEVDKAVNVYQPYVAMLIAADKAEEYLKGEKDTKS